MEINPKISEHFSKLGKKSWKVRQAKILGNLEMPAKDKMKIPSKPQKPKLV